MNQEELLVKIREILARQGNLDAPWAKSLLKTAQSKNIDISEWNTFVYKVAEVSASANDLKEVATLISEYLPPLTKGTGKNSIQSESSKATADYAVALGEGSEAKHASEAVFGRYNNPDEYEDSLFTVGNGTAEAHSNAFVVHQDGRVSAGADGKQSFDLTTKRQLEGLAHEVYDEVSRVEGRVELAEATLSQHETTITQHGNTINQHGDTINQHGSAIAQHENTLTQHGNTLTQHGSAIAQHGSAIDRLESATEYLPTLGIKYEGGKCLGPEDRENFNEKVLIIAPTDGNGTPTTSIRIVAFSYQTTLECIEIPDTVKELEDDVFRGCTSVKRVKIPFIGKSSSSPSDSSGAAVRFGAMFGTDASDISYNTNVPEALTDVVVTGGSVPRSAFQECTHIEHVDLTKCSTAIGNWAFRECTRLTSVKLPEGLLTIGNWAFSGCSSLTSFTIPDGVTSIGSNAFSGCSNLTSIVIPNSVTSIGDYAFSGCSALTSITVPNSVISIGYGAFSGCSSLESITLPFVGGSRKTESDTYQYPFGYIFGAAPYAGGEFTNQYYYGSSTNVTTSTIYFIPSSLKSVTITGGNILYGAFYNCGDLTSITLPDTVTSIGDSAFYNCDSLGHVTIPDTVVSIGKDAFRKCQQLTRVTIGNSVREIGDHAFASCNILKRIIIPQWVNTMGEEVFANCHPNLTIYVKRHDVPEDWAESWHGGYSVYYTAYKDADGSLDVGPTKSGNSAINAYTLKRHLARHSTIYPSKEIDGVVVRNKLKFKIPSSDPYFALVADHSAENGGYNPKVEFDPNYPVYVPSSVPNAQYEGADYTRVPVDLPVNSVAMEAFQQNRTVTSVVFQEGLMRIEANAFNGCKQLTSIVLADTIKAIDNNAFNNVGVEALEEDDNLRIPIRLPKALEYICQQAFNKAPVGGTITFPSRCLYIGGTPSNLTGGSGKVFTSTYIEAIVFEGTPKFIHPKAFEGCKCRIYVPWRNGEVAKPDDSAWGSTGTVVYNSHLSPSDVARARTIAIRNNQGQLLTADLGTNPHDNAAVPYKDFKAALADVFVDVSQETGTSTTAVMSQKAVSTLADGISSTASTALTTANTASSDVNTLKNRVETLEETVGGWSSDGSVKIESDLNGGSTTSVPSQKAVADAIANVVANIPDVVQDLNGISIKSVPSQYAVKIALEDKVADSITQSSTSVAPSQRAVLAALTSSEYNATHQLSGHMSPEDKTKLDTFDFKTYSSNQKSPPGLYVASVYLNVSGVGQKYYFSSFYRAEYETVLIDTFIGGNYIQLTVYSDGTSEITDSDGLPISAFTNLTLRHIGG